MLPLLLLFVIPSSAGNRSATQYSDTQLAARALAWDEMGMLSGMVVSAEPLPILGVTPERFIPYARATGWSYGVDLDLRSNYLRREELLAWGLEPWPLGSVTVGPDGDSFASEALDNPFFSRPTFADEESLRAAWGPPDARGPGDRLVFSVPSRIPRDGRVPSLQMACSVAKGCFLIELAFHRPPGVALQPSVPAHSGGSTQPMSLLAMQHRALLQRRGALHIVSATATERLDPPFKDWPMAAIQRYSGPMLGCYRATAIAQGVTEPIAAELRMGVNAEGHMLVTTTGIDVWPDLERCLKDKLTRMPGFERGPSGVEVVVQLRFEPVMTPL